MRILLAPDRFAGPLTAVEAAAALRRGWLRRCPGDEVDVRAMSDGAAGLIDVVHAAAGGHLVPLTATGPLGEPVLATLLHVPGSAGGTTYVEAGQALGRHLVPDGEDRRYAEEGTSVGLGELLLAALATGASRVVVGLGAASTHDAGAGMLAALAGGCDAPGVLRGGGLGLGAASRDDVAHLGVVRDLFAGRDVVLAVASTAPLQGLHGAGAQLAARPGIGPAEAQEVDRAVGHLADALERATALLPPLRPVLATGSAAGSAGAPAAATAPGSTTTARALGVGRAARADGSGAGGGAALALQLLGARVLPGAQVVSRAIDLPGAVGRADVVVTGTTLLDSEALVSSAVATVAEAALGEGLPVVVLAEEVQVSRREAARAGISGTYEVAGTGPDPGAAGLHALEGWGERLARTWSTAS
ncbi:glycerate kinase [Georgenia wangjunii]|uniref:glycerate kinase n=1 Tax=Georgenia wangjunii TaxID=3117730 RepID=UPI002F26C259